MILQDSTCETVRILTVTLNPTLDVATRVERLVHREKLRCETEQEQVGGGGINVAQVIHSLGTPSTAAFTSGGWRGREILSRLTADGIECLPIPIAQESRQCFTVYETSTEQEYRFILPGPTLSEDEAQRCLETLKTCTAQARWLILSGSLAPGLPDDFYRQVIDQIRRPGKQIILDTSGAALSQAIQSEIDWIKPSRDELQDLMGLPLSTLQECEQACHTLMQTHPVKGVALSLGGEGALVCQGSERLYVPALPVKVTSTVGAGDSFVGGLVWALDQGLNLTRASQIATASAAAALQTQGQLRFDPETILRDADHVKVQPLNTLPS